MAYVVVDVEVRIVYPQRISLEWYVCEMLAVARYQVQPGFDEAFDSLYVDPAVGQLELAGLEDEQPGHVEVGGAALQGQKGAVQE